MDVLFELLATQGRVVNSEKFKKLEGTDKLFEFKSHQIRIPCFFTPDKKVILLFGLRKKTDKYKREDIERAEAYRGWYLRQ